MSLPLLANVAAQTVHPVAAQPLTHVVLFKLKDRSPDNLERTAAVLRSLDGTINVLRHIEVGVNVVPSARAYDVALITRFDSLADMEAYQVHPRHQEVLAFMREQTDTAAAVDYNTL
ncbi:MAG: Dabb family protein [Anaerolineales bacterium]|nr:Dabb family protein [Anaerolineales bacterium]